MSSIAVAAPIVVNGPAPRVRMHSLLTVPNVVVPPDELEERWEGGVHLWAYPEDMPDLWDACSSGTNRVKEDGSSSHATPEFQTFMLYVPIHCSVRQNVEELAPRALKVLQATQAWGVEKALARGVVGLGNPHLDDANMVVLGGGSAVSAGVGISYLEEAISGTGREGLIHITPAVAAALTVIPTGKDGPSDPIYTAAGTPVSVGAGYALANPHLAKGATPAAGPTEDWIFATGPVAVRIAEQADILPDEVSQAIDRSQNIAYFKAEKVAVVVWDTVLQVGVLVDWTL